MGAEETHSFLLMISEPLLDDPAIRHFVRLRILSILSSEREGPSVLSPMKASFHSRLRCEVQGELLA